MTITEYKVKQIDKTSENKVKLGLICDCITRRGEVVSGSNLVRVLVL